MSIYREIYVQMRWSAKDAYLRYPRDKIRRLGKYHVRFVPDTLKKI